MPLRTNLSLTLAPYSSGLSLPPGHVLAVGGCDAMKLDLALLPPAPGHVPALSGGARVHALAHAYALVASPVLDLGYWDLCALLVLVGGATEHVLALD